MLRPRSSSGAEARQLLERRIGQDEAEAATSTATNGCAVDSSRRRKKYVGEFGGDESTAPRTPLAGRRFRPASPSADELAANRLGRSGHAEYSRAAPPQAPPRSRSGGPPRDRVQALTRPGARVPPLRSWAGRRRLRPEPNHRADLSGCTPGVSTSHGRLLAPHFHLRQGSQGRGVARELRPSTRSEALQGAFKKAS